MENSTSKSVRNIRFFVACLLLAVISFPVVQAQQGAQSMKEGGQQSAEANLKPLFRQTEIPSIFHKVIGTEGKTILAPKGTEVVIPPNCFVRANGEPVTGEVKFELKEIFDNSDFLLSHAPTVSNGRMLESAGTVFMAAYAGSEPVTIAPGKKISIRFPEGTPTEEMKEFRGEIRTDGSVNWVLPGEEMLPGTKPAPKEDRMKVDPATLMFADGQHELKAWLYSNLDKRTDCCGEDNLNVTAYVHPNGKTIRARCSGFNSCYFKSIVDLMQHVSWDYDKINTKDKTVTFRLEPEKFCEEGNRYYGGGEFREIDADTEFMAYNSDFENYEAFKENRRLSETEGRNIIEASKLGWINCDRFIDVKEKTDIIVNVDGSEASDFARVFLVFKDIKSVTNSTRSGKTQHTIANMPVGKRAYAVAIAYKNEKPYVGVKEFKIGSGTSTVSLEETTIDGLKKKIKTLDAA